PAPAIADDAPLIRIVQPNIAQLDKWRRELRGAHFSNLLDLSSRPAARPVALLVWPETATPFDLSTDADSRRVIAARALAPGAAAAIGTPRRDDDGRVRNSLVAVGDDGGVRAIYDKHHLVPFGEYVPFGAYLPFGGLVGGGFAEGPGPRLLDVAGLKLAPLICYEAIFPRYAGAGGERPDLLVNITNDAWFDDSPGPRQHVVASLYRAIEQGVPLVRAANTGVSLVADARGRILEQLDFGARGVIDRPAPAAFETPPPASYAPLAIPLVLSLFACVLAYRRS
ncbi:MAG: apolipoprotein N-acyltransferase, partial [Pseudomonadota bacterium]